MTGNLFGDLPVDTEPKPRQTVRPVKPHRPDPVADALIAKGFVPNDFILDLNKGLTVPSGMGLTYPWSLPSRLFTFPIEVTDQLDDGSRKIGLLHPLLADHPFVKQVETTLGISIDPNGAANEYGFSKVDTGKWWHAVDLVSRGMWRELLDTARFTTPEDIAGAVSYGLDYSPYEGKKRNGHISSTDARTVMAAIAAPEPFDAAAVVAKQFCRPSGMKGEKGAERWPINSHPDDAYATAWGHILAIEAGWFAHDRAGFLGWTEKGRNRFPPESKQVSSEIALSPTQRPQNKPAAPLTDTIAPRPNPKTCPQMNLF